MVPQVAANRALVEALMASSGKAVAEEVVAAAVAMLVT